MTETMITFLSKETNAFKFLFYIYYSHTQIFQMKKPLAHRRLYDISLCIYIE